MNTPSDCIAILGPTCCWKSAVGLKLAEACGGEIVSCDSMQVYRGLDIGTAKATDDERRRVPHHLIDILDISEPYDANRFVSAATEALDAIRQRGHKAFLVGGTGLYARALIYGFELLPSDAELFRQLDEQSREESGRAALLQQLEKASAELGTQVTEECRLNPRRLVRACEVLALTGKPPWLLRRRNEVPDQRFKQFCIVPPLPLIKERIFPRTRLMLEDGWIEEAEQAAEAGLLQTPTARQALGYADIIRYLHDGQKGGLDSLCELLANKTVQYARRQLTWFKHQHPGAVMLTPPTTDNAVDWLAEQITINH
jgi:tRNA dimethylallyltransferase